MIWIDLVIAGALLLGLAVGAKRGFLQTLGSVAALVLSFVGAGLAAAAFSGTVAGWIKPLLMKKIMGQSTGTQSAATMVREAGFFGDTAKRITDTVGTLVKQTTESLASAVAEGIAQSIAYAIVYLVAFVALMLVLRLLLRALKLAGRLPGLHGLNVLGGGALGLVVGGLLVFLAVWLLQRFHLLLTEDMVEQSMLLKFFVNKTPMDWISSL